MTSDILCCLKVLITYIVTRLLSTKYLVHKYFCFNCLQDDGARTEAAFNESFCDDVMNFVDSAYRYPSFRSPASEDRHLIEIARQCDARNNGSNNAFDAFNEMREREPYC